MLRDPAIMMLVLLRTDRDKIIVRAENLTGEIIFDHVLSLADLPNSTDVLLGQVRLDQLPPWVNDTAIRTLFERRLLTAVTEGADDAFVSLLNAAGNSRRRGFDVRSEWRDQMWRRYEIGQGKRQPEPRPFRNPRLLGAGVPGRSGAATRRSACGV